MHPVAWVAEAERDQGAEEEGSHIQDVVEDPGSGAGEDMQRVVAILGAEDRDEHP
jgi:hypothetical protein